MKLSSKSFSPGGTILDPASLSGSIPLNASSAAWVDGVAELSVDDVGCWVEESVSWEDLVDAFSFSMSISLSTSFITLMEAEIN